MLLRRIVIRRPPHRSLPRAARVLTLFRAQLGICFIFFLLTCHSSLVTVLYAQGQITPQSIITTVAGNGRVFRDNGRPATSAALGGLTAVAVDSTGNIFATDTDNYLIVKIAPTNILTVVAGNNIAGYSGDGGPATSASLLPTSIALDAAGNLYMADSLTCLIRRVGLDGIINSVAGNGVCAFSGDGGPATSASLSDLSSVAMDLAGNLYVADASNNRIRKVASNGIITTVAGKGVAGFSGDGGPAVNASLNFPRAVTLDSAGNIYITDNDNFRVRKVSPDEIISTVAGNGVVGFSGDGGLATNALLQVPRWGGSARGWESPDRGWRQRTNPQGEFRREDHDGGRHRPGQLLWRHRPGHSGLPP